MKSVNTKLRDLRTSASPKLSVRGMAAALDMPLGTYSAYESARYKKPLLPLDFARRVAAVLARHKVDPAEVMKLAGLNGEEVEPEAREIEAQLPAFVSITLPVILPSEVALRDMFRSLLVLVPEGATKDEAAAILARRLPAGLAAIGPLSLDQAMVASLEGGETVQSPATEHRA
ncbi:XRE family transcriptional regulator [Sphingobium yanoikuyae]|uniref:XRE family transcriptional regulator n=1 Tax=Sphingobium yanoikuyae TaxID=13690 RepID=UPI0022DD2725|nr:XRE family transcriptional regulator [Sphingobium yanoikuyae]WBQ17834.1 XRE family transcriptional regulator [Sphingobium yanoikuyae]